MPERSLNQFLTKIFFQITQALRQPIRQITSEQLTSLLSALLEKVAVAVKNCSILSCNGSFQILHHCLPDYLGDDMIHLQIENKKGLSVDVL